MTPEWTAVIERIKKYRAHPQYMPAAVLAAIDLLGPGFEFGEFYFEAFEAAFEAVLPSKGKVSKAWQPFFHLSGPAAVWALFDGPNPCDPSVMAAGRPKARGSLARIADRAVLAPELLAELRDSRNANAVRRRLLELMAEGPRGRRYWATVANPNKFRVHDYFRDVDEGVWTVNREDIEPGDRVAVWQTKDQEGRRGIVAVGEVLSRPSIMAEPPGHSQYWSGDPGETIRLRIKVRHIKMPGLPIWEHGPNGGIVAGLSVARAKGGGVYIIEEDQWRSLEKVIGEWPAPNAPQDYPDEVPASGSYPEGASKRVYVNAYERNRTARDSCISHFGSACSVCGFDFEVAYGEVGKGFIHVHHVKQLSTVGEGYEVDPLKDLRPVCPNCHAMLHRTTPAMPIEALREMLRVR